jgi:mono/diheme cytochrome c family protein
MKTFLVFSVGLLLFYIRIMHSLAAHSRPHLRRSTRSRVVALAGAFVLCFHASPTSHAALDLSKLAPAATRPIDFAKEVAPVLESSCLRCHNAERSKGKFQLDTREHALKGGDNGIDIMPGESAKSSLIHFVARMVEDSEMPPVGKGEPLSRETVGILRAWIDQGAKWPETLTLRDSTEPVANKEAALSPFPTASLPAPATGRIDFVRDIQPIFSEHCYECHGLSKQEAQFRLDSKDIALSGGELGLAILPGNGAGSLLVQAVSGLKPDLVMPKKGEHLTSAQVATLRAWIDQGAQWPDSASVKVPDKRNHWAFKAPVRPALPAVQQKHWVRNPIDQFVLARLEKEKLKPSPEADRATLIRRLSLDLIGLPPSIKEIEDFLADTKPDAYDRLVERLLASPHYGERWGRHWLDLARYADTNGYEKDKPRSIWPYRDWVIRACNADMTYDRFVTEQLAGDLLPNPTLDQEVATGFLRNAMLNQEGGIEPEQFRVETMIDRMDTLGKSMLGLTVNCCQCHNHKYDPFSQKEYYQLYAFLNNDDEAFIEVPSAEQTKLREEIRAKVAKLEDEAMKTATNLDSRMDAWETSLGAPKPHWTVLDPKDWQNFATKFEKQDDGSLLGGGDLQPGGVMRVWTETSLTNITGFRLEALTNPNLIYGGPGLIGKGSFIVKEFTVEASALDQPIVTNTLKFRRAVADQEAPGFGIANAIDGRSDKGGWVPATTPDRRNQPHRAVFECDEPNGFSGGTKLLVTIHQSMDSETKLDCHMLGCLRLSVTTNDGPLAVETLTPSQKRALAVARNERSEVQKRDLFEAFRLADPVFADLNKQIDAAFADWPYPPTSLVLKQRDHPRTTRIFKRGDRVRPGDEVQPQVLSVLNPLPEGAPRNRLGLAEWIVSRKHPTTARVEVNRMWQTYFGQGLVTTPEDFGTRVETPSHPELLDWLACELMEPSATGATPGDGAKPWSLKHLHRLIVTSATYRQSSRVTPELYQRDQYNRWLARGPRFRVEGEIVEDIALSVSGLLNLKIGGPSVYPPIPANIGDTVYGGFSWPDSKGDDRHRRAMYTFCKRSLPFPNLSAFDTPTGETSCPRRMRSNTPLQALTTLNEKTFVQAAQAMALRVVKEGGVDDRSRATFAFRLCTGRKPTPGEIDMLLAFWKEEYDLFENSTATAVSIAVADPKEIPPDVNLHKVAAWAMVSRAILNLDETVTKE